MQNQASIDTIFEHSNSYCHIDSWSRNETVVLRVDSLSIFLFFNIL